MCDIYYDDGLQVTNGSSFKDTVVNNAAILMETCNVSNFAKDPWGKETRDVSNFAKGPWGKELRKKRKGRNVSWLVPILMARIEYIAEIQSFGRVLCLELTTTIF